MQIAIDCRLWNEGGVGRYIRNLVSNLALLDKENKYTLWMYKNLELELRNFELTSNFEFRISNSKWHSFSEQTTFCRELEKGNYDLVHFPYFSHPIFYRKPFVVTIHDLTILHFATGKATTKSPLIYGLKRAAYLLALQHAVRESKKIIVPTNFVQHDLETSLKVDAAKIQVTYEGVDSTFVEKKAECPSQITPQTSFLLYVGNCYPHKNVEFLIDAVDSLKQSKTSLVLVTPDDFFAQRIKSYVATKRIASSIIFIHKATTNNLKYLYQHAKKLILPSLFEGFGLPVVEAAKFNCPLILSDIPVFHEIAPKGAAFFNPKDVDDLVKKLNGQQTTINVSKEYFEKFSFEKMAVQTLDTYNKYA